MYKINYSLNHNKIIEIIFIQMTSVIHLKWRWNYNNIIIYTINKNVQNVQIHCFRFLKNWIIVLKKSIYSETYNYNYIYEYLKRYLYYILH